MKKLSSPLWNSQCPCHNTRVSQVFFWTLPLCLRRIVNIKWLVALLICSLIYRFIFLPKSLNFLERRQEFLLQWANHKLYLCYLSWLMATYLFLSCLLGIFFYIFDLSCPLRATFAIFWKFNLLSHGCSVAEANTVSERPWNVNSSFDCINLSLLAETSCFLNWQKAVCLQVAKNSATTMSCYCELSN